MPGMVYILCGLTSMVCSILLLRGFRQSGVRLLLWSGLCFIGLTAENFILYIDMVFVPDISLALARKIPGLIALMLLLYGLVWDAK